VFHGLRAYGWFPAAMMCVAGLAAAGPVEGWARQIPGGTDGRGDIGPLLFCAFPVRP
jgi:hypothetical protein